MPDITMCMSVECLRAKQCHRHHKSGTQYGMKQSVSDLTPKDKKYENCRYYWEKQNG